MGEYTRPKCHGTGPKLKPCQFHTTSSNICDCVLICYFSIRENKRSEMIIRLGSSIFSGKYNLFENVLILFCTIAIQYFFNK